MGRSAVDEPGMVDSLKAVPTVSVVICTFNRCERLGHALESVVAQSYPSELTQVIVVDNGSTDRTADVVERFQSRLRNLLYLVESRPSVPLVRNRGLEEARGWIVAFLDDDAIAAPTWVEELQKVWVRDPDVSAVGGPITVQWPGAKPTWMPVSLEGYFGRCDYGPTPKELKFPQYPFGSNMAFRRDRLMELGGFDSRLGVKGRRMLAAEETDLFLRLERHGGKVLYAPEATVIHCPPDDRVTRRWSLIRAVGHGRSNSVIQYLNADRRRRSWAAKLLTATARTAVSGVSTIVAVVSGHDTKVIMSRSATTGYWAGFARGSLRNVFRGSD